MKGIKRKMNDSNRTVKIAVIDGDARQRYLASLLAEDGYDVSSFCPGDTSEPVSDAPYRAVIFPVKPKENINDQIKRFRADNGAVIFSWSPCCDTIAEMTSDGWASFDFAADEALAIKNAYLTAEGALSLYMNETSTAVRGSHILVFGSGRVAKCVSGVFAALGADVTMAARSKGELAWAQLSGIHTAHIRDGGALSALFLRGADAVINTIPARVLPAMPKGILIIDLASAPYGIGEYEAETVGARLIRAGGLPGKYAPESAASLIADVVRRRIGGAGR